MRGNTQHDDDDDDSGGHTHKYPAPPSIESLGLVKPGKPGRRLSGDGLPKMGKFRFQLFANWIAQNFSPCRVADVGGGKGILSYFLKRSGFDVRVIDPVLQALPEKLKDLRSGRRIRFSESDAPQRISIPFEKWMIDGFDLIVALHAHGSNIEIIDACAERSKSFAILPCCVIDEPEAPPSGVNWFSWLTERARARGIQVAHFQLNFKGQNIGIYKSVSVTHFPFSRPSAL